MLTLEAIGKSYRGVPALAAVSLQIAPGETLGIVGANGAGKSTLIKILTGYFTRYEGRVRVAGTPVELTTPARARAAGIDAVYQDVDAGIAPGLTVAENLSLNVLARGRGPALVRRGRLERDAHEAARRIGLRAAPSLRAGTLSLHEKQLLLIARAVSQRVRYLIFDEPTASLSLVETERLFDVIGALREDGVGVVYVSHRLAEVARICDRVAVLRNGRHVADFDRNPPLRSLAAEIIGMPPEDEFPPRSPDATSMTAPVALEARDVTAGERVRGVSLEARRGEILGITGLVGAGKTELLRALFGADPLRSGSVLLDGIPLRLAGPRDAVRRGVFLVPEERVAQSLYMDMSGRRNLTSVFVRRFTRGGVLNPRAERAAADGLVAQLQVRGDVGAPVATLSGGNQQKVAIGKWLAGAPRVLLFDEATQGVDIGTRRQIYALVRDLSRRAAIIYATSDIDEAVGIADRLLVLRDGRVAGAFDHHPIDRQAVIELATGARREPGG